MRSEDEPRNSSGQGDPVSFVRGLILGYQVGREEGFGEGVRAMHRVIAKMMRDRRRPADKEGE